MYKIREYEEKDKEQLIKLWVDVAAGEFGYTEWTEEIKADELAYERIFVVEEDNKIIGSMAYKKVDEKTAELKRVYIYKEYRGRGISKELYNKVLEVIKEEKYEKIMVETWQNFQSGIAFYYKNDYKLILKDDQRYVLMLELK